MFIFFGIFVSTAFGFALYSTFLNREFYRGDLVKAAHELIIHEGQKYIDFQPIVNIDKKDFSAILEKIVLKQDLIAMIDNIVEQFNDLIIGDQGIVELKIPLSWMAEKGGDFGEIVSDYLFENLPKCDSLDEGYLREFNCIPEGLPREDFKNAFRLAFDRKLLSDFPDDFNFQIKLLPQLEGENLGYFLNNLIIRIFIILGGAMFLMLVMIALLVFKPWSAVMKWTSKTVFLASLSTILAAMFLNVFIPVLFDRLINSIDVSLLSYNAWMAIYIIFIGAFTVNLLKIVFPIALISLGFWIAGMLFHKNKLVQNAVDTTDPDYKALH